jgi:integrase/recombinase XerD
LLAIDGLRISEALGADIDQLGLDREGGKIVTIPPAPSTSPS